MRFHNLRLLRASQASHSSRATRLLSEPLEQRCVLSGVFNQLASPDNLIFAWQSETFDWPPASAAPVTATNAAGNYVVVWAAASPSGDGGDPPQESSGKIFAQRYSAAGQKVGNAIVVAEPIPPDPHGFDYEYTDLNAVMAADGSFIVTWDHKQRGTVFHFRDPGPLGHPMARSFDANGQPLGVAVEIAPVLSKLESVVLSRSGELTIGYVKYRFTYSKYPPETSSADMPAGHWGDSPNLYIKRYTADLHPIGETIDLGLGEGLHLTLNEQDVVTGTWNRGIYGRDGLVSQTFFRQGNTVEVVTPGDLLPGQSTVAGRHVFYNNSKFDGDNPAANAADDAAIATDKTALLPGQVAGFQHVTSYAAGINGVMVDLTGSHGQLDADDFVFRVGNSLRPDLWWYTPQPVSVTVRHNQGAGGSDRVEIVWPDDTIRNAWLQVAVLANGNTGLAKPDVFYFGNRVGDTSSDPLTVKTDTRDALAIINRVLKSPNGYPSAAVNDPHDINRDGRINSQDLLTIFNELGAGSAYLTTFENSLWPEITLPEWTMTSLESDLESSIAQVASPLVDAGPDELDRLRTADALKIELSLRTPSLLMEKPQH